MYLRRGFHILDGTYQAGISVLWSRGYAVSGGGDSAGERKPDHGFVYQTHRIYDGKPALAGLPATYTEDSKEAQTLEIELKDELIHTTLILYYTILKSFRRLQEVQR